MRETVRILLAEDNDGDVYLVRRALDKSRVPTELIVAHDGEAAWRILEESAQGVLPFPDLLLLDLNLPRFDGEQILIRVRETEALRKIPIIVLTSSDSQRDRERAIALGATLYFRKPIDLGAFMDLGKVIADLVAEPDDAS